jgi:hypothetical protein
MCFFSNCQCVVNNYENELTLNLQCHELLEKKLLKKIMNIFLI